MSLEQELAANTAAIVALTAVMAGAKVTTKDAQEGKPAPAPIDADKSAGKAGKAGKADKTPPAGMTAEDLTKAIVKAVGATDKDTVLGILKKEFGVAAGKEVTDPAVRQEIADRLATLSEDDLG